MGGSGELLIGFTAQVSPGEAVIAAGLPLVGGGLNGAINIKKIGEGGAEDVALQGLCWRIELVDAHMAGIGAISVVAIGTNGDGAAVSGEGDAPSGEIASGFSIDVSAELLPIAG